MADNKQDPSTNLLERLTVAFEMLAAKNITPSDDRKDELMTQLAVALGDLSKTQLAGSKLIADETRKGVDPSNRQHHEVSVFNRQGKKGNKKPPLKCLMMVPWFLEWESCTREEVELANLLEPGDYIIKRIDNSKIRVDVKIDYKVDAVTPSRLLLTHETAFNNENRGLMPSLADIFRQVCRQNPATKERAAAVMSDEEEEALIEAGSIIVNHSAA